MNKRKIIKLCFIVTLIIFVVSVVATIFYFNKVNNKQLLFICPLLTLFCLIILEILLNNIGYYECPKCKEHIKVKLKDYLFGLSTLDKRKLKCPKCGNKGWFENKTL